MKRLQRSRYPAGLAGRIVMSGVICYERKLKDEISGKRRLHRPESDGKAKRMGDKITGKSSWLRGVSKCHVVVSKCLVVVSKCLVVVGKCLVVVSKFHVVVSMCQVS